MKVSIITVCFNSAKTIRDTLESVWRQKRDGVTVEYIVVDGNSRDDTVGVIKEFEHRVSALRSSTTDHPPSFTFKWISEPDEGLYHAMNKGIGMATGEVVGIVNSDDMLNSDHVLEDVVKGFEPTVDVIYSDVRIVPESAKQETLNQTPSIRYIWPKWWKGWMLSWGWTPPHPGLYIRKSVYEKFGAYLTGYEISSDDEIIVRLVRKCGAKAKYLPICTSAMRTGGKSQSGGIKTFLLQNREFVEMNRANGYFCALPMMFPKLGIKALEILIPRLCNMLGIRM